MQITRVATGIPRSWVVEEGSPQGFMPRSKMETPLGKMVSALTPGPCGGVLDIMVGQGPEGSRLG